jgi:hypothetical protein
MPGAGARPGNSRYRSHQVTQELLPNSAVPPGSLCHIGGAPPNKSANRLWPDAPRPGSLPARHTASPRSGRRNLDGDTEVARQRPPVLVAPDRDIKNVDLRGRE